MTTPMTQLTTERLAFVRYLYDQGLEQAQQPEPFSATAVLSLHDAVEQFLRLAADHLEISLSKGVNFAGYWKELEPGLPTPLPGKGTMDRLNEVRVRSKHHGIIPSATAIRQFVADTTSFFTDATPLVFGVAIDGVDMIDLVALPEISNALRKSQGYADAGDLPGAMAGLMVALTDMVDCYTESWNRSEEPPFSFGPTVRQFRNKDSRDTQAGQIETLTHLGIAVQRAMRLTVLGIDYHRYAQFEVLAPVVHRYMDGSSRYMVLEHHRRLTTEDYQVSRSFVIESAIKAARVEAALNSRLARREANAPLEGVHPPAEEREWGEPWSGPRTWQG